MMWYLNRLSEVLQAQDFAGFYKRLIPNANGQIFYAFIDDENT